jgi:hypothetical protein
MQHIHMHSLFSRANRRLPAPLYAGTWAGPAYVVCSIYTWVGAVYVFVSMYGSGNARTRGHALVRGSPGETDRG